MSEKSKSGGPNIPLIRYVAVLIQGYDSGLEEDIEIPEFEWIWPFDLLQPTDVPQPKPLTPPEIGPPIIRT